MSLRGGRDRAGHAGAGLGYVKFQAQVAAAAQAQRDGNNNSENGAPVAFTNVVAQHDGQMLGTKPPKSANRYVGVRVHVSGHW